MKDMNTTLDDITDLVNNDSSLTVQVLRLSNSALYAGGVPIDTLDDAINRIGFSELFKLVGMAAAAQVFTDRNELYDVEGSQLWENSLACALAMEYFAKQTGGDPQEAYTIGLLRSMGKMILNACLEGDPDPIQITSSVTIPLHAWEDANFGITNSSVAGFVLVSWNFPDLISRAIQYQYIPEEDPDDIKEPNLLHIASLVAENIGKGLPCELGYWEATNERLEKAGLNQSHIDAAAESINESLDSLISSVAV